MSLQLDEISDHRDAIWRHVRDRNVDSRWYDKSMQLLVFGDGAAGRDHVAISDVADVIVRSITQFEKGVINVASGQMRTFAQVAELVRSVAPSGATVASVGSEANPTFRSFDLSGLIRRFPDHIPTTPEIGIAAMLRLMVSAG